MYGFLQVKAKDRLLRVLKWVKKIKHKAKYNYQPILFVFQVSNVNWGPEFSASLQGFVIWIVLYLIKSVLIESLHIAFKCIQVCLVLKWENWFFCLPLFPLFKKKKKYVNLPYVKHWPLLDMVCVNSMTICCCTCYARCLP